jgi:hypothetical protein
MTGSNSRIAPLWRTLGSAALAMLAVTAIGFTTVAPAKARVAFGFSVGGPTYYGGYYPYYGYAPYYGYPAYSYYSYPSYSYYTYPSYGYYGGSDYGYDYSR